QGRKDRPLPAVAGREERLLLLGGEDLGLSVAARAGVFELVDREEGERVGGERRHHPTAGRPVEGGPAGREDELDAAHLVDVTLALRRAVARPLLAAEPLNELLNRRLLDRVDRADRRVPAEVEETVESGAVAVLGAERQLLDVGDGVEEALDHLLGAGTAVA